MGPGALKMLSERHKIVAMMVAAGYRQVQISRVTGYTEANVSLIKNSPMVRQLIDELQQELKAGVLNGVLKSIADEAGRSVNTLVELRDGGENDSVRLNAASKLLFDGYLNRVDPVRKDAGDGDRIIRITFGTDRMDSLRAAAEEDGAVIDVTPLGADSDGDVEGRDFVGNEPSRRRRSLPPPTAHAVPIDDYCHDYEARAADEAAA